MCIFGDIGLPSVTSIYEDCRTQCKNRKCRFKEISAGLRYKSVLQLASKLLLLFATMVERPTALLKAMQKPAFLVWILSCLLSAWPALTAVMFVIRYLQARKLLGVLAAEREHRIKVLVLNLQTLKFEIIGYHYFIINGIITISFPWKENRMLEKKV